jgi:putative FmdB family regulatory protein
VPTYQYACTTCGNQLEVVQSFSDAALTVCPACDGQLRKVFSAVGIVFKGSGFYRTDSRSGSSATDSGASTSAKSDGKESTSTPATSDSSTSTSATSSTSSSKSSSSSSGSSGSATPAASSSKSS